MHEIIKLIATYGIGIPVLVTAAIVWRTRQTTYRRYVAVVLVGGVVSLVLAKLASHLYNDPRPFVQGHFTPLITHARDNGFPSDHTLFAAFLAWAALSYSRKIGLVLLAVAALIGLSRMAAGIHHLSDIVGSFLIALIGWGIAAWGVERLRAYRTVKHSEK